MRTSFLSLFVFLSSLSAFADDCESIRRAIAALPASGGEALVPAGIHTCAAPVILDRDNVTLRGTAGSTLRLADNSNSPLVIMGDIETPPRPVTGITVRDLALDGNRLHQQLECWGGPCDGGGKANIRNNGITVRGVTGGRIENIAIRAPRSGGVVSEKGCVGLVIDGLTVTDSQFDGFAGYETTGADLRHMDLSGNAAAGISIDIRFHGNTIRDTKISGNHDVGIFMRYANDNRFENVTIENSGNHGVFVAEAEEPGTCPLRNDFVNLAVSGSKGYGFLLNNECEGNRLSGTATFRGNSQGCYREASPGLLNVNAKVICEHN